MCLFREAQCTPETQPGSTKRAFRALKIHSATAGLAALGFQWINFIKKLLLRGNHSDTSGGNRTVLPYVLGSYIRSSSRGAQLRETQFLLIKRTFFLFPHQILQTDHLESGDVFRWIDAIRPAAYLCLHRGQQRGEDYASQLAETRAREGDLFSRIATENLQPGDHFHHRV